MTRQSPPIATLPPVLAPIDGLRQRARADGSWRVWWEPSAKQAKRGAITVDLSHLRPGEAQRRATALTKEYSTSTPSPRSHSVDSLITDYLASHWFAKLRASTQATYRQNLRPIAAKWGPHPVPTFTGPIITLWYETLYRDRSSARAHALITMMQILFKHAERRGWIAKGSNPCADIGMEKPVPEATRVATAAEITALIHAADGRNPALALALRLSLNTGQRIGDIRDANPADFQPCKIPVAGRVKRVQGYIWRMVRSKRSNAAIIPIIDAELVAALNAQLAREDVQAQGRLLLNGHGLPFTRDRLGTHYDTIRAIAVKSLPSLAGLQWRDLRRTFGVRLRMANVSRDDVGDILGNTVGISADLAARYTPATTESTTRAIAAVATIADFERKKA